MLIRAALLSILAAPAYAEESASLVPDCSGVNCGAEGSTYSGTGIGIWTYRNATDDSQPLDIALDGLTGNRVTLVFSNLSPETRTVTGDLASRGVPFGTDHVLSIGDATAPAPYPAASPAEQRVWHVPQVADPDQASSIAVPSTLRAEAGIDGFRYRIWVADADWTDHMEAEMPRVAALLFGMPDHRGLLQHYLDAYPAPPWGDYPASRDVVVPTYHRDVDFIIAPNGAGNIQFFDASQTRDGPDSNRALALFIGSDSLACKTVPQGLCFNAADAFSAFAMTNTILHEFTHLVHHYQRSVLMGPDQHYAPWLREAIATSQGFSVAYARFPDVDPMLLEVTPWFAGGYVCPLIPAETNDRCTQSYYSGGQAFLLYLLGQYGTNLYAHLLTAPGTGIDALDVAIRASGGQSFEQAFRKWGGMLALLPHGTPSGFGMPGVEIAGSTLPPLNGSSFAPFRKVLPPDPHGLTLAPLSHSVLEDTTQSASYQRKLMIPPDTAVTIYVQ